MNRKTLMTAMIAIFVCSVNGWTQDRVPPPPKPQNLPDSSGRITTPSGVGPSAAAMPKGTAEALPQPTAKSGFGTPEGLTTPADELLPKLGFGPAQCFPLTPVTCFEVGYKCYCRGLFRDALAFADHGLKLSNHARLYLLKAVCEMHLGDADAATSTIAKYRSAALTPQETIGLYMAQERINDPMRVRLEYLLDVPQ